MVNTSKAIAIPFLGLRAFIFAQGIIRFGPHYSLGPTSSLVVEAVTTLFPGQPPNPERPRLALWAGSTTPGGDLVQSIVLSSTDDMAANCGGKPHVAGQWCAFASVYHEGPQEDGAGVPLVASQGVTIHHIHNMDTGNTDQTVSVNGQVVSTLSTPSGNAQYWGTAVECQNQCQGIVNPHKYVNTTITLASPDANFAGTLATQDIDAIAITTMDNRAFSIDTINVHQYYFPPA